LSDKKESAIARHLWWLLLIPGVSQLVLLCAAMFSRLAYPYDLEWMEGGLLTHAQRIADGAGIYVEPSVEFIPYLYTPLYPGVIAMFSELFGIGYGVGRSISVLAVLATCALLVLMVKRESESPTRKLAWVGGLCAVGFFAATYPWVEGWYDLVRADSLFMLMVLGGLYGLRNWAASPHMEGLAKLGCACALLAFSFFTKQTGVLFVATGGFLMLGLNWKRVPFYVAVTGVIGLGGTWLLNRASGGWFWVYIYETHQHHDFNMDRFYKSFGNILWHFPVMTCAIGIAFVMVIATYVKKRKVPVPARSVLIWTPVFAVAVLVGAIGWGTQFAHFNAYVPAMLFGALCAGLAVPAVAACAALWLQTGKEPVIVDANLKVIQPVGTRAQIAGGAVAAALGVQLILAWWKPATFVPSEKDEQAGHELIRTLEEVEGDVFIPYHPWYAHLAGKKTYAHLMGLRDMTTGKVWPIVGLREAISKQHFGAIVLDNRPLGRELSYIHSGYRMDDFLPETSSPHVFTGAGAVWNQKVQTLIPRSIWVANSPLALPEGAKVLWNFESGKFDNWTLGGAKRKKAKKRGRAWGNKPVSRPLPKQGPVRRYGGRYYVSSFHGGDKSTGTLRSPTFVINGSTITFRLGGGKSEKLRAELRVQGEVVRTATGTDSERMEDISWSVAAYAGQSAEIVLIDDEEGSWGHMNVDEFWIW
jgi:hypothetical protein